VLHLCSSSKWYLWIVISLRDFGGVIRRIFVLLE